MAQLFIQQMIEPTKDDKEEVDSEEEQEKETRKRRKAAEKAPGTYKEKEERDIYEFVPAEGKSKEQEEMEVENIKVMRTGKEKDKKDKDKKDKDKKDKGKEKESDKDKGKEKESDKDKGKEKESDKDMGKEKESDKDKDKDEGAAAAIENINMINFDDPEYDVPTWLRAINGSEGKGLHDGDLEELAKYASMNEAQKAGVWTTICAPYHSGSSAGFPTIKNSNVRNVLPFQRKITLAQALAMNFSADFNYRCLVEFFMARYPKQFLIRPLFL
jgi:hypothetical protein